MTDRSVVVAGGVEMPLVGLGTWRLSGRAAYEAVRYALEAGCRHLATASPTNLPAPTT